MTMGLTACNNGDDVATDRTARLDRNNTTMNVGNGRNARINNNYDNGYNATGVNNRGNGFFLGNGRDDGIDHNGPLTEDYSNNDNSDSDIVRDNHRNNNRTGYNVNNRRTNRNVSNVNNVNNNQNRNIDNVYNRSNFNESNIMINNHDNNMVGISAYSTNLNSNKYPHTKAILIQDAKYKFVPFGSVQWYQYGMNQQGQQQQLPKTEAPKQQAPIAQAPAPIPVVPAVPKPAAPAPKPAAPTPKPAAPAPKPAAPAPAPAGEPSQFVQQVINLTNAERSKQGLPALKADTQLNNVAQKKSVDMQQNNYFSHTSPTYGSPFDMMRDFGVTYKSAGENIAQGQRTPQEVVTAWMNSEGHRKNILSGNFTHIGVGFEQTGNHWTQMFIGK